MAAYEFNDHLTAQLNVMNIFDKTYYTKAYAAHYAALGTAAPRCCRSISSIERSRAAGKPAHCAGFLAWRGNALRFQVFAIEPPGRKT